MTLNDERGWKKMAKYTYIEWANEVKDVINAEKALTAEIKARIIEKADALIETQVKKADYNAKNTKKATAKGASAATLEKADNIARILDSEPKTTADINSLLGTEYTPLQVANAAKYIVGAKSAKIVRDTVNAKGLTAQKEYTAYTLITDEQ